ncbi:MAG: hypothetical protein ACOC8B_03550 [Gemmatimonadota bacterium]
MFGWSAADVVDLPSDGLGYGQDVIEGALSAAGYAAGEIRDAVEDFFGEVGDVFCGIFGRRGRMGGTRARRGRRSSGPPGPPGPRARDGRRRGRMAACVV